MSAAAVWNEVSAVAVSESETEDRKSHFPTDSRLWAPSGEAAMINDGVGF